MIFSIILLLAQTKIGPEAIRAQSNFVQVFAATPQGLRLLTLDSGSFIPDLTNNTLKCVTPSLAQPGYYLETYGITTPNQIVTTARLVLQGLPVLVTKNGMVMNETQDYTVLVAPDGKISYTFGGATLSIGDTVKIYYWSSN